jgi:hypothetical protein
MASAHAREREATGGTEESAPGSAARREWWWRGWLLDADGSADWEPLDASPHREAAGLAERFGGRLVRMRGVPDGYEAILSWDGPARTALDPGPHGIVTVLTPGWPDGPPPPAGAMLLGPVSFLVSALRRRADPAGDAR